MEYSLKEIVLTMLKNRKNGILPPVKSSYRELAVKASVGMGVISYIPWISYCAKGQSTNKGIYPVLLFYGTPEFIKANTNKTIVNKIVLAYGISATNKPQTTWGSEVDGKKTIGEVFKEWNYKTSNIYINKYNSSYVYKAYDWTDKIDFNIIQEDLDHLIDTYINIIKGGKEYEPIDEPSEQESNISEIETPDIPITVKLSDLAKSANATLPDSLLEAIKKMNPKSFEVLIARLLVAMGYGNTTEDVIVTQYVGDYGIDGYVRKDRLDIEKLCAYQAKRYTNNKVGIEEMNALGGAMINYSTNCGIFVTTSDFTPAALKYDPRGYTIKHINGQALVKLLIEYGIGIKTERIEVKTVDTDFLNNL